MFIEEQLENPEKLQEENNHSAEDNHLARFPTFTEVEQINVHI